MNVSLLNKFRIFLIFVIEFYITGMDGKVFVGLWVAENTRTRLKIACAIHNVNQGDVMDLLLMQWLKKPHIEQSFKELLNGTEKN